MRMRAVYVGDVDSETENEVCSGKYQLVYLSAEALLTNVTWRDMLQNQQNLVALVIDEAHCVKKSRSGKQLLMAPIATILTIDLLHLSKC